MLEARAFEPEFLRRLDGLALGIKRSRTVRAGRRAIGRVQGLGIEPENFKEYAEGDDLRFLDWNAYARLDDLFIRTYRAERQVEITVLIDASASMRLPERDDKFGLASALGASLAYVGMGENDAVRLGALARNRGGPCLTLTPFYRRREMYPALRPFITGLKCRGETQLATAAAELLHERRPPGVVLLISDFLVSQSDFEDALERLLATRHEVKVVHVLGEMESHGSYPPGRYRLRDAETGELREAVLGPAVTAALQRKATELAERIRQFCVGRGVVYAEAFGAGNLDAILARELPALGVVR